MPIHVLLLLKWETNWIEYICSGMPLPIAQVEESWQMAEFYSNKVYYSQLVTFLI
jgi:hypothetical protein